MRDFIIVGTILLSLAGCTNQEVLIEPSNTGYISSVGVYGYSPYWEDNYYYGVNTNWYAGTPDYFSPSVYTSDW